ncbi:MAG: nitroreductase family deazaflavin-dependent oxidoreductase [Frankiaceae bacterium]|nr:nitroreductase family deazaflavin-dependent oxidoreductase [Frankiaceae bacterium]MBV9869322.1 nitroreductase family deazaflavin-dependent oxidoreductase [Frankiaceae bacterium]
MKRRALVAFRHVVNPIVRPLAGFMPWWMLIETTGNKTGKVRRVPLATGLKSDGEILLLAAHGRAAGWVRNIAANPQMRIRHKGRWLTGTATIEAVDPAVVRRFNPYARLAGGQAAIDPTFVRFRYV